nr:AzlD domain-containing protein [Streptomyces coryli]
MALFVGTLVLGAGTFAFRFAGPVLKSRMSLSPRVERLMAVATVVLLAALVATQTLLDNEGGFSGVARTAGVAVAGVLAWKKAPFVVVVVAAAGVAAGLRLLGVS